MSGGEGREGKGEKLRRERGTGMDRAPHIKSTPMKQGANG